MSVFPEGLEPVSGLEPAAWVHEALKEWPPDRFRVRDLVPPVFEAYARILHRPFRPDDARAATGSWFDWAHETGHVIEPETDLRQLEGTRDGSEDEHRLMPEEGRLSEEEVRLLTPLLAEGTETPDRCWFALWFGFGGILDPGMSLMLLGGSMRQRWATWRARGVEKRAVRRARRQSGRYRTFDLLGRSGRSYWLMSGTVYDAARFTFGDIPLFQSPTLWWPDDQAWFLHTEIDSVSTYLGGSRDLVDRLVGEQILESFEVEPDSVAGL